MFTNTRLMTQSVYNKLRETKNIREIIEIIKKIMNRIFNVLRQWGKELIKVLNKANNFHNNQRIQLKMHQQ